MHANLILALAQAALVTVVPGPDDNCPSSAQVQAALELHAPRLLAPRPDDDPASQLSLALSFASPTHEMGLTLLDSKGRVRLYRALPPPPGDRAHDCAALADTVAFIVDRYFDEVQLPALPEKAPPPPAPPPPPPAPQKSPPATISSSKELLAPKPATPSYGVSAMVGRRLPGSAEDLGGIEFKLTLGAQLAHVGEHGGELWGELSGGVIGFANQPWRCPNDVVCGNANVSRYGGDAALLLGWPLWHARLYAGPLIAPELIWLDANANGRTQHEYHTGLAAGLRAGLQYFWKQRFFARLDVTGAVAIVRQKIVTRSADLLIFATPPAYVTFSLGAGIWF